MTNNSNYFKCIIIIIIIIMYLSCVHQRPERSHDTYCNRMFCIRVSGHDPLTFLSCPLSFFDWVGVLWPQLSKASCFPQCSRSSVSNSSSCCLCILFRGEHFCFQGRTFLFFFCLIFLPLLTLLTTKSSSPV